MTGYSQVSDLDPEAGDVDELTTSNSGPPYMDGDSRVNLGSSGSDEKSSSLLIAPKAARTLGWGDRQAVQKPAKEKSRLGALLQVLIAILVVYHVFQVYLIISPLPILLLPSDLSSTNMAPRNLALIRQQYASSQISKTLGEESWETLQHHVSLLDVSPIPRSEFLSRQATLARVLDKAGIDAFIAEPSASSAYLANISTTFELSERPFLVIITKTGQFSYLAPKFELGRIAGLEMVYENKTVIEWHEQESPFEALKRATGFKTIMLDEHVRFFIASGLEKAGIKVVATSEEVQSIRAVKSRNEIVILKAINEFTVELVRSLQKNIKVGVTQAEITAAADYLFSSAGIGKGFWALVLIGEQAANPHGGSYGRVLKDGEFVLIDIGSSLYGYGSDVTRTFLPAGSTVSEELLGVWWTVYAAQTAAIARMKSNETCSVVDATSRKVGFSFTRWLGDECLQILNRSYPMRVLGLTTPIDLATG